MLRSTTLSQASNHVATSSMALSLTSAAWCTVDHAIPPGDRGGRGGGGDGGGRGGFKGTASRHKLLFRNLIVPPPPPGLTSHRMPSSASAEPHATITGSCPAAAGFPHRDRPCLPPWASCMLKSSKRSVSHEQPIATHPLAGAEPLTSSRLFVSNGDCPACTTLASSLDPLTVRFRVSGA